MRTRNVHFAVLDVETTGLDPATTRMVEIAIVEMDQAGRRIDEFSTLIDIPGDEPLGAEFIHRISRSMLDTAPRFDEVVGSICTHLAGRIVVGHMVNFDIGHLSSEFARSGGELPDLFGSTLCTRDLALAVLPPGPKTLAACCDATGVENDAAHTALGDARATAELLLILLRSGYEAGLELLGERASTVIWPAFDVWELPIGRLSPR
jgi:DNA polymerase-3 subunit epsilon